MPPDPLGSSGFARGQPRCGCMHIHFCNLPVQPLLGPPFSKSWIRHWTRLHYGSHMRFLPLSFGCVRRSAFSTPLVFLTKSQTLSANEHLQENSMRKIEKCKKRKNHSVGASPTERSPPQPASAQLYRRWLQHCVPHDTC